VIRKFCFATTAVAALAAAGPVLAQEPVDAWQVSGTVYLWATTYDNDVTDKSNGNTSDSSASFGNILDGLSGVFLGKAEVQHGRVGAFADLVYMKLSADRTTERRLLGRIKTKADVSTTAATVAGYYRVVQTKDLDVDLVGGLRYVKVKLDLDVQGGGPGLNAEASKSKTEPVLGVRATQAIGPRSSITGYGDYGGFGDGITVWQLVGTYNYQWKPNVAVFGGYRHFAIEIDKPRVSSDVSFSGPVVGLTYRF
jgi:hypothetical protein